MKRKSFDKSELKTCTAVRIKKGLQVTSADKLHFLRCKSREQCLQCKFAMVKKNIKRGIHGFKGKRTMKQRLRDLLCGALYALMQRLRACGQHPASLTSLP